MNLTREVIAAFFEDEEERKKLNRQADDLESKNKAVKAALIEHVKKVGGKDLTTVLHGFVLSLKTVAGTADWKGGFIALAGAEKAEELRKKAAPKLQFQITKVA